MTLHEIAKTKNLWKKNFTKEDLDQKDRNGNTVWHISAANKTLQYISASFFTEETLKLRNNDKDTICHIAACNGDIKKIQRHLLTGEILNQKNKFSETVWYLATYSNTLTYIPQRLFTEDVFSKDDTLWNIVAKNKSIRDIPLHLVTKNLLTLKDLSGDKLFSDLDETYINYTISNRNEQLNTLVAGREDLAKDIEFRDPRLILTDISEHSLLFEFNGLNSGIVLNKEGNVLFDKKVFNSLNDAVIFIQNNYNIEQSLTLPQNPTEIDSFVL